MKILIATGIYPPDIGGPAQYARGVEEAWLKIGYKVKVLSFKFERKLPTGIRHLYYFLRVLFSLRGVDFIFSPDTFSAALPALFAAKLARKKLIIRTGGDFLWEQYVERTGDLVLLRNFYNTNIRTPDTKVRKEKLSVKERTIFNLLRFLFCYADATIFSTAWQRDIFEKPYRLDLRKCFVVENYYGPRASGHAVILKNNSTKIFVGGVRDLQWKNMPRLKKAFERVQKKGLPVQLQWETGSRGQFLLDIQSSYAVIIASLGDVSPNTILEAIQFGKPFILTRECGLYEKLKDIGVWVDPENIGDIAAKIEWLCDEKNYAEQCKKVAAFSFTHSWEEIAGEVVAIYKKMS
jgi:glycosyltransferase involved in cell wall biosynthesis